jgi:microsomal epoxide hydrolase/non-specific protein-tyrosine kinase
MLSNEPMFPEPHFVTANGLDMAVYEQGDGPAVIFLHGFPELAYSWRHQLPAFADAGFRAIAPDLRGYGRTTAPPDVADYRMSELIADVDGLLDALELERAIFVGHDWGALILWNMAMLAPQRIERLVILNIPHFPRLPVDPISVMRERFGNDFYIVNFQDSDEADRLFASDPARFINRLMRTKRIERLVILNIPHFPRLPVDPISVMRERFGNDFYIVNFQDSDEADRLFASDPARFINRLMRKNQLTREQFERLPPEHQVISLIRTMQQQQASGDPLLTSEELEYYAAAFAASGFTGPINWYRHWTQNWEQLEGVDHSIDIPTLFIGAHNDVVIRLEHIEGMKPMVGDLTMHMLDCGHWTQQEEPEKVNRLILDWLQ